MRIFLYLGFLKAPVGINLPYEMPFSSGQKRAPNNDTRRLELKRRLLFRNFSTIKTATYTSFGGVGACVYM